MKSIFLPSIFPVTPGRAIAHHIGMARLLEKELLLVEWTIEENARAKVTVCTKDRYGLFSKITGSMFLNRLNILEAQIHTWANGVALDTFKVEDATREIERRLQQFKDRPHLCPGWDNPPQKPPFKKTGIERHSAENHSQGSCGHQGQ